MKTEKPILMSTPMVQAILEGRKSQTRRIVKPPKGAYGFMVAKNYKGQITGLYGCDANERTQKNDGKEWLMRCPYGDINDILWVRETWFDAGFYFIYRADSIDDGFKWRPSIFMPKEANRIKLEITGIRVEKLCDITEEDAMAEGSERGIYRTGPKYTQFHLELNHHASYKDGYKFIWETINGKDSWGKNPWVWVLSFKKVNALETSESPLKE